MRTRRLRAAGSLAIGVAGARKCGSRVPHGQRASTLFGLL